MIVRILGEGQFDVDEAATADLNVLDSALEKAVNSGDEAAFRSALTALLGRVREIGTPAAADTLSPSDLILPYADADIEDVRAMLKEDGLIPG
jgi:PspAA-like protein